MKKREEQKKRELSQKRALGVPPTAEYAKNNLLRYQFSKIFIPTKRTW
ncbi:MAG TPA: hypothetical protein PKE06_13160 [Flavilitoribacter sp.]|nr:hypothetical protein [Flavilitoribacter sp.]HMQ89959.1 hypothetical protein [Flavilitoribacter sp.]